MIRRKPEDKLGELEAREGQLSVIASCTNASWTQKVRTGGYQIGTLDLHDKPYSLECSIVQEFVWVAESYVTMSDAHVADAEFGLIDVLQHIGSA